MDKETLKQYRDLTKEIEDLRERIAREGVVKDTVRASSPHFPYSEYVLTVEGVSKTREVLEKRKKRAERLKHEIDQFIADIPDARTRRIFEWRYIRGKSWAEVSRELGYYSENYARVMHDRYLQKLDK
jgi:hypothetical protein